MIGNHKSAAIVLERSAAGSFYWVVRLCAILVLMFALRRAITTATRTVRAIHSLHVNFLGIDALILLLQST